MAQRPLSDKASSRYAPSMRGFTAPATSISARSRFVRRVSAAFWPARLSAPVRALAGPRRRRSRPAQIARRQIAKASPQFPARQIALKSRRAILGLSRAAIPARCNSEIASNFDWGVIHFHRPLPSDPRPGVAHKMPDFAWGVVAAIVGCETEKR